MEEATPEEKQQFLRKNILDKKEIDANKFVEFLKDKKGEEGADISNWTMEDLKEVVKEFYQTNNIPTKENIYNSSNNIDIKEINKNEQQKENIIKEENKIENINNNINININNKIDIKDEKNENMNININKKDDKKENIKPDNDKKKEEKKDESIKFIIDEDSLLDFMLTEKGLNKNKAGKEKDNKQTINTLPISKIEEKSQNQINNVNNINNINTTNTNQQFNFDKNFKNDLKDNNNIQFNFDNNFNNNSDNDKQQFNFDKNFKNDLKDNNNISFNFEKNFTNNNLDNNKQQFNFEKNFTNNNLDNNKQQFNFEQNFKNNNLNNNINNNQKFNFEENFKDINKNINNNPNNNYNNNDIPKINKENIQNKNYQKDNSDDNKMINNVSTITNNISNINNDNNHLNNNNNLDSKNYNDNNNDNDNDNNDINDNVDVNDKDNDNVSANDNKNISEESNSDNNYLDNNIKNSNLTNMIDKNDHDSEYGIIIQELIKTKKIEKTEFTDHKDIVIKISDPIKVEPSFFLGKSVNYLVATSPFNYAVRRKYSDFNWLRETLINFFNTNLIPKITKKGKVTTDKHDDIFIQKRMKYLEKFINFLIKDELIKSSQILYDFLTIQNEEDFQQRKKFYDKLKISPFIEIKERKSINGELKIKITKEKEIYLENIKDNTIYNGNLFKKLNNNFKLLQDEFLAVIKRFESISDVYRQLYDVSKNYLDQNIITESYAQMEIMFNKLSQSFDTIKKFINSDIREYFKFVGNNFNILNEMTQNVDLAKNNYIKLSKSLISKKNDLFKKGDISKWELSQNDKNNGRQLLKDKNLACNKMLPKETQLCINSKEIYGFYLNRLINEYERMRQINAVMHKKKISFYCKEQITICSEYTRILGDIIMSLDSCINKPK